MFGGEGGRGNARFAVKFQYILNFSSTFIALKIFILRQQST